MFIKTNDVLFQPNMYRIMQMSGQPLPAALKLTKLFHAKRNRVEFIEDFPENNEAEVISSLLLHPQGWVAVSRNLSADDESEWCCVHDLHAYPTHPEEDELLDPDSKMFKRAVDQRQKKQDRTSARRQRGNALTGIDHLAEFIVGSSRDAAALQPPPISARSSPSPSVLRTPLDLGQSDPASPAAGDDGHPLEPVSRSEQANGLHELIRAAIARTAERIPSAPGPSSERQDERVPDRTPDRTPPPPQPSRSTRQYQGFLVLPNAEPSSNGGASVYYFGTGGASAASAANLPSYNPSSVSPDARLHHNQRRLTHYVEESNQGRGFIKEICFSSDGRVIGSPYGFGIRLLSFDQHCRDLSQTAMDVYDDEDAFHPSRPKQLNEVMCLAGCHQNVVLSSTFSPHDYTLVTGDISGKVAWHQPVL